MTVIRLAMGGRWAAPVSAACAALVMLVLVPAGCGKPGEAPAPQEDGAESAAQIAVPADTEPAAGQAGAEPAEGPAGARNPLWAVPLDEPGLSNLHKVADGLYRSAQPTAEGMERARELGIKTVVNLRATHSDRDEIGETGLAYEHIPMTAWHPEDEDVVRFLQIVTDPARQPVLVHCQHGADRTGMMCAAYRVAVQGWSVEDAAEEMTEGGYGFHEIWRGTLVKYLRALDFEDIRRRAGLAEGAEARKPDDQTPEGTAQTAPATQP